MRTVKSSRKPPRPSIDNPRLVTRMKSSAAPKRPTLRPAVISEELGELGVRTRRRAKLNDEVVSASNVGKAASTLKTSQPQSLSVSWMDSLRSFKVRGPGEASSSRSVSSRKSPRNNSSLSTSTLRSHNTFLSVAVGNDTAPSPQTQRTVCSKSSNTPIQSFKFKPTDISELGLSKKQTPVIKSKAPTPSVVAFGTSFNCQTPTDFANNNLNTPKLIPKTREGVRKLNGSLNVSANGGKSSPKNSSKQRGVILPLLREKDTLICQLEETISTYQDKFNACSCDNMHQMTEENSVLKREKEELESKVRMLSVDKKALQEEVEDSQAKMFDLETKNMSLINNLEYEQAHVESLQTEINHLMNAKLAISSSGDGDEEDMERLIETFIERLGFLCRDQSLKMSISSRNVKLSIKTRAEQPSSRETTLSSSTERLESTHLSETEVAVVRKPRCRSFRQFAALQEDEEAVEVIKSPSPPKKNDKPKKGVSKKATRKTKGKENSQSEIKVISPTMGEQMGKLKLNDNNHLDVSEARLTRSMAKNRSVSMTNIAARKVIL